jgi:D-alanyl-D-alanine carboxypeptidase/D-alanyl-D-alanine-endopeptidase (penicillin-binding protein 4)
VAAASRTTALRHAIVSVSVRQLSSGTVVYARNAELSMTPASALKLATTAAALDAYGPEARFKTTLQAATAPSAGGGISGDLFLVAGGDPSLSRELEARPQFGVFELLADALVGAGVRRVDGKLIGCDGLFTKDRRGEDWTWEDLVWWYGAEVAALTFADGAANLKIGPGPTPGAPLTVERHPESAYYRVESTGTTCSDGTLPGIRLDRRLGGNVIALTGCLPAGWPVLEKWLALEDPVLYASTVMSEALEAKGVDVVGGVATCDVPPPGLSVLATYEGAPMAEILKDVNKPSHNVRAEMLLRLVGSKVKSEGSARAGTEAVLEFLKARGADVAGWDLQDGSGLSRTDLVTARGMTDLLVAMNRHKDAAVFRDSLPVAGVDGTLKSRLGGRRTAGRISAKTGRIRHSSALAGYARPRRGAELAFAILVNHASAPGGEVQDAIDAIATAIVGP